MSGLQWLESHGPYVLMLAALSAGIAAAFGRELEAGRRPNRGWWVRRLLILPVLAIAATAAADLFDLQPSVAAFTAAMLSLGGYDVLCMIESRWKSRLQVACGPAQTKDKGQ